MRFGESCPCGCGYKEWVNWRRRWLDEETDYVETENVPDLEILLQKQSLNILEQGQWTYRLTRNGKFVERMLTAEYRARGGGRRAFHPKARLGGFTKNSLARKRIIHSVMVSQHHQRKLV